MLFFSGESKGVCDLIFWLTRQLEGRIIACKLCKGGNEMGFVKEAAVNKGRPKKELIFLLGFSLHLKHITYIGRCSLFLSFLHVSHLAGHSNGFFDGQTAEVGKPRSAANSL